MGPLHTFSRSAVAGSVLSRLDWTIAVPPAAPQDLPHLLTDSENPTEENTTVAFDFDGTNIINSCVIIQCRC